MDNEQSNHQPTSDGMYEDVASTVVTYMVDCGLKDADVTAGEFHSALAYAYKPFPRFWRDFKLQLVIAAVSKQYPGWTSATLRRDEKAQDVLRNFNTLLERNAFDEANAEMLMALPTLRRPATPEDAMKYLCERFVSEGLSSELKFAQWIGLDCGEQALEMMRGFERAAAGTEYTSPSARFARLVRSQCIAKRQATAHAEA
ncbi:hypothetical protein [Cupriavidus pauculus]|uniref:hypothetical protein n=1 Tax=Cupriavidus pauculus TaxID=82633 RepID=UPI001FD61B63|nr:hypothetical protein [Cupriavidus pauculus]